MSTAVGIPALEDTYARAVPGLVVPFTAAQAPDPQVVVLDDDLARDLGFDPEALRTSGLLVGRVPEGVRTVAQAYSGHQFGMYQPRLGDGRALLVGEVVAPDGSRHDLHLKGSGRTPFARGGDGKAALGPMLREYLMGTAMHALGIPTSRGLAVSTTGERVPRDTGPLPGAVLARVASSHLRVGTFQYAAVNGDRDQLRALADHAIARHHPHARDAEQPYLEFFRAVVEAQAALVAQWMLVGFVHGVMNTDNTTISGETIDYGPCAFMDRFDPDTVFSSIDHAGRYAYGHQPPVVRWNLARLAEALLPLIDDDTDAAIAAASAVLEGFAARYDAHYGAGMAAKLGLREPDESLVTDLLALLHAQQVDWTTFFRALPRGTARDLFLDRDAFDAWAARREAARDPEADPDRVNPVYIPRNHLVDEALTAAERGDLAPFERILDVVRAPFTERPGLERYTEPGTGPFVTYCGT
ncbi:protein adenylyltransferase SelO family protein [Actinomycetospora sp. TBRC 11914]|uniref:protein adenylyltransferase SelO n=1 Tax=Actinomycetospora sp. TBRC 11914 TaxID=2729387 RepID=UPI00289BEA65|nr:YdiU family protein [Actinomycetospora sp. TBRC 11914]